MRTPHILAWLGVTPFTIALILSINDKPLFGFNGVEIFTQYSLVIICFMAGTLWGQVIQQSDDYQTNRILIGSNILALVAFFTYLMLPNTLFIYSSLLIFIGLLTLEAYLVKNRSMVVGSYWPLRVQVTTAVCVHHLVFIVI